MTTLELLVSTFSPGPDGLRNISLVSIRVRSIVVETYGARLGVVLRDGVLDSKRTVSEIGTLSTTRARMLTLMLMRMPGSCAQQDRNSACAALDSWRMYVHSQCIHPEWQR